MIGLLLESPALQEELGLTAEQGNALSEVSRSSRDRQRELFRDAFGGGRGGQAQGGGGRGQRGPQGFRMDPQQMEMMQQAMMQMRQENEAAVAQVLDPKQRERLEQIRLRIIGPTAVAEERVAGALMLAEEQFQQIQQIMAEYDAQSGDLMRRNFEAMSPPGGPGGPGGLGRPGGQSDPDQADGRSEGRNGAAAAGGQVRPNPPGDTDDQDRRDRRREFMNSPQFREIQDRMARMAEEEEQLLKRAEAAIAKVLTSRQKQTFNRMLGREFDLTKLVQAPPGGRRGDGRNPPGVRGDQPGAPPAAAAPQPAVTVEEGETPAVPRSGRTRIPPRVRGYSGDRN